MKKKTDKIRETKKKRKKVKGSNQKTERIWQKNKKIQKKERNPFDDYLEELEKYDAGTPKKIIEAED